MRTGAIGNTFVRLTFTSLLAVLLAAVPGCSPETDELLPPDPIGRRLSEADLTIGLLPERNVFEQKKKYLPLEEYLTRKLDKQVYFKLLDNYEHIFEEILDRKVDGGFWGSMNGAIAQLRGGIEILARPVWEDGSSTYFGYVFTRRDSGITADPQSWAGRSMAFVNKATTAGFLYPMSLIREAGIGADPADFFSRAIFSGSHDAAILSVFQGEVDMGAAKNTIFQEYIRQHPDVAERLVIISESPEVPSNGLGVRPDLPQELKDRLKEVLISMEKDPQGLIALQQFGARRFIASSFADYDPVIKMADKAGIDLEKWPLRDVRGARPYR